MEADLHSIERDLAPTEGQSPKSTITIGATLPLTGSESRIGGFFKEALA